jgi:hypothetical protein
MLYGRVFNMSTHDATFSFGVSFIHSFLPFYVAQVRAAKLDAIAELESVRARLIDVLSELGEPVVVPVVPTCDDEEFPERGDKYTPDSLRRFKVEMAAEEEAAAAASKASGGFGGLGDGGGGGGGGGGDDDGDGDGEGDHADGEEQTTEGGVSQTTASTTFVEASPSCLAQTARTSALARPSAFGALARKRLKLLVDERDTLRRRADDIVFQFDRKVQVLLEAKREAELRIKFAEFQHIVCVQTL